MVECDIKVGCQVFVKLFVKKNIFMADSVQLASTRLCLSSKEKGQGDIDRISDLPDWVLCHILSFLPTKTSVATSILSKRWLDLWIMVPVVSISSNFLRVTLPRCLFACRPLVCLELYDNVFVDVPPKACFPSLRILRLERVIYANDDSFSRLLYSCPVLQDLTVQRVYGDNLLALHISVPSLKVITLKKPSSDGVFNFRAYKLLITAPLLEKIELKDRYCKDFLVRDLPNLVEATIDVYIPSRHQNGIFRLLKEMGNVKFLSLSEWIIFCPTVLLPVFRNLVHLEMKSNCEYWHGLVELLECSDNLKTFVFDIIILQHDARKCDESLPERVPKCVLMNLETFKLSGFSNNECDWKLVRYILENAKSLKQMKIGVSYCSKKLRHRLKKLLKYSWASMACEICFSLDSSEKEIHL